MQTWAALAPAANVVTHLQVSFLQLANQQACLSSFPFCSAQEEVAALAARRQELLQQLVAALGLPDDAAGQCRLVVLHILSC